MDSAALLDLLGNENRRRILRLLARKPCYVTEISEYLGVSPKAVIDHLRKLEESGLVESHVDDGRRKYFSIARNLRLEVNVSPYDFGTKSAYSASPNLDIASWRYVSLNLRRPGEDHDAADGTGETVDGDADAASEGDADAAGEGDADAAGEGDEADGALEVGDAGDADAVEAAGADVADPGDSGGDADPDVAASTIDGGMAADEEPREPEETTMDGDGDAASSAPGTGSDADDLSTLASDLRELERLENELSMAQRWVQGRLTDTLDRISAHFEGVDGRFYAELLRGLATGAATAEELSRRVEAPPDVVEDALEGLSAHGVVEQDGDVWELA